MRTMSRALAVLAALVLAFACCFTSIGCNEVFGIVELPATDAGTPSPTSSSTAGGGDASVAPQKVGLLGLTTSIGPIAPGFDQDTYLFTATPSVGVLGTTSFTVTPTTSVGTNVVIAGSPVGSGFPSNVFTRASVAPNVIDIAVTPPKESVRHYTLLVPAMQGAYVKASNTTQDASFGRSVAISKDGSTLAIGAQGESSFSQGINGNQSDTSAKSAGAVYIFVHSSLDWKQQAYIKASNTRTSAQFGSSVALSDNGNTLIVGAIGEASATKGIGGNQSDNSAQQSGAAYVFARSGTTWSQDTYVKASNTRANAQFGGSVTVSGDGATFAVGSYGESSGAAGINGNQNDTSQSYSGAVYVFQRSGGSWVQQAYVKASNPRANASFGYSIAISGDATTLAVGAYGDASAANGINGNQSDTSAPSSGATYVYTRNGGSWGQQAYVKASNTRTNALFGCTIALSTNGNTMAVGAYGESSSSKGVNGNQGDTSQTYSGAAYVFERAGIAWTQEAYVKASNTRSSAYFGSSVGLSGDGAILAVGSFGESGASLGVGGDQSDGSHPSSGAAYVFDKKNGGWSQQTYAKASNSQLQGEFGYNLAMSADGTQLAVGAYGEPSKATGINGDQVDFSMPNAGAVYLFP